jgi:MFS family permease
VLGYLGDRWGRKAALIAINALQVASTVPLFFLYTNPLAVWVLTSVLSFSVGGDFGASYAALAELIPARHRGKAILLSTNFWNVGSAVIAGAALVYAAISSDPLLQTQYVLLTAPGHAGARSLPQGFGPRVASMAHPTGAGWGGGEDCLRDS